MLAVVVECGYVRERVCVEKGGRGKGGEVSKKNVDGRWRRWSPELGPKSVDTFQASSRRNEAKRNKESQFFLEFGMRARVF